MPVRGGGRRVAGLRREELALLAGVSADYYTRLEQGRATNVSDRVLQVVADALRLDSFERRHLFDLAGRDDRTDPAQPEQARPGKAGLGKAGSGQAGSGQVGPGRARPALRMMLDALDPLPALIHTAGLDVVATNRMGKVLLDDFDAFPARERNLVHWMFLNPRARSVYPDWPQVAAKMVAILRGAAGTDRRHGGLAELIEDIAGRSDEFTQCWNDHQIYQPTNGTKRFFHEAVGIMTINHESLTPASDPDLSLLIYTAATGSPSEEKLDTLSRWAGR